MLLLTTPCSQSDHTGGGTRQTAVKCVGVWPQRGEPFDSGQSPLCSSLQGLPFSSRPFRLLLYVPSPPATSSRPNFSFCSKSPCATLPRSFGYPPPSALLLVDPIPIFTVRTSLQNLTPRFLSPSSQNQTRNIARKHSGAPPQAKNEPAGDHFSPLCRTRRDMHS